MTTTRRVSGLLAAMALAAGLLAGCGPSNDASHTLTVLAGSELKDLEPMFPDIQKATGITLQPTYSGTLEGAEKIAGGEAVDAAWFSHGKYLSLLPGAGSRIVSSEKIMLSPVVMGVRKSVADAFGWTDNPNVTWKDIQAKAADGSFKFAMTNPAASNSGLTALIGVASALSGSSDALDSGAIDKDALRALLQGPGDDGRQLRVPRGRLRPRAGHRRRDRELRVRPPVAQRGRPAQGAARPDLSEGGDRHRGLPADAPQQGQAGRVAEGRRLPPDPRRPGADHEGHRRAGRRSPAWRSTRGSRASH